MTITIVGANIHAILNELSAISVDSHDNILRSDREVIYKLTDERDNLEDANNKLIKDVERLQNDLSDYDEKLLDLRKINVDLCTEIDRLYKTPSATKHDESGELRTARADLASMRQTLDTTDVQLVELRDKYEEIVDNLRITRNINADLANHLRAANERADTVTKEIANLRAMGQLDNSPTKD